MIDLILHAVLFAAWLVYTFPPMAEPKYRPARAVVMAVLSVCIGVTCGRAVGNFLEVLMK